VVGDTMGKYHPHGDQALYDALVRMAQPFSIRYPLVDGQGNFGSVDGDPAAAMRYTECRLAEAAEDVLGEIGLDTVPHRPTYDGTRTEPVVLPTRLPLLLVNGSTGIAVGVATNIPPHNLFEVVEALIRLLDDPSLGSGKLAETVRGPDFPTGGEILDPPERLAGIYEEGKGSVRVRGTVEDHGTRRHIRTLFITSVPYGVNKAQLVQRLGEIVADRSLPALLDVSDLSTDDVRIRLEVRKDVDQDKVLAFLYKRTPLQSSVSVDLTCLRFDRSEGGIPERVGLRTLLQDFLDFRREVVRRRLEDERRKLDGRLHILDGLARVFDALDRILKIVRASDGKADAAAKIMAELPLDREQMHIVFLNVLLNAAQAMGLRGKIDVGMDTAPGECEVSVADRGPGIAPDLREKMFQPFFSTKSRGAGLGLPTARRIVESHGGTLVARPRDGGGTAAWFERVTRGTMGLGASQAVQPRHRVLHVLRRDQRRSHGEGTRRLRGQPPPVGVRRRRHGPRHPADGAGQRDGAKRRVRDRRRSSVQGDHGPEGFRLLGGNPRARGGGCRGRRGGR